MRGIDNNPEQDYSIAEAYERIKTGAFCSFDCRRRERSDLFGPSRTPSHTNLTSGVYYGLDRVGTRIWSLLQHPRTVREIRDRLLDHYDVDSQRAENDLIVLLQKLSDAGLLEVQHESRA